MRQSEDQFCEKYLTNKANFTLDDLVLTEHKQTFDKESGKEIEVQIVEKSKSEKSSQNSERLVELRTRI